MANASLTPGTLVAEHFEVLSRIASDEFVERYLARDLSRRGHVLLHIVHRDATDDGPDMPLKELEEASRLFHPNLAAHHGCGRSAQDLLFMVQGYPPGELLDDVIEARVGVHPLKTTIRRGTELLDGLTKAHEAGVYHGALDPRAVLVEHIDATRERARILGLGIEQALRTGQTIDRTPISQRYVPPDAAAGSAADLYGVGALLLAMLGGEDALDTFRRTGALPGKIDAGPLGPVLKRALAPEQSKRFADAETFRRVLQDLLEDLTRSTVDTSGGTTTTDDPTFDGALSSIVGVNNPGLDVGEVSDTSWTDLLPNLGDATDASSPLAALHEELALQREAAHGSEPEEEPTRISGPPVPDEEEGREEQPHRVAFPDPVSPPPRSLARPANKTNIAISGPPSLATATATEPEVEASPVEVAADAGAEAVDAAASEPDAASDDAADAGSDDATEATEATGGRKAFKFSLSEKLGLKFKSKTPLTPPVRSPFAGAPESDEQSGDAEAPASDVATAVVDAVDDTDGTDEAEARDVTHLSRAPTRTEGTAVGKPAPADAPDAAGGVEGRVSADDRQESTQIAQRPVVAGPPPPPRPIQLPLAPEGPPPGSSFEMIADFDALDEDEPIADDDGITPLRSPEPIGDVVTVEHAALLPSTIPVERLLARELEPDPVEETTQPRTPRGLIEAEGGGSLGGDDDDEEDEVEDATTDEAAVTGVERRIAAAAANDDRETWAKPGVILALIAVALIVVVLIVWPGSDAGDDAPTQTETEGEGAEPTDDRAEEPAPTTAPTEVRTADDEGTPNPVGDDSATEGDPVADTLPVETESEPATELTAVDPAATTDGETDSGADEGEAEEDDAERDARRRERRERRRLEREAAAKAKEEGEASGGDILNLKVD